MQKNWGISKVRSVTFCGTSVRSYVRPSGLQKFLLTSANPFPSAEAPEALSSPFGLPKLGLRHRCARKNSLLENFKKKQCSVALKISFQTKLNCFFLPYLLALICPFLVFFNVLPSHTMQVLNQKGGVRKKKSCQLIGELFLALRGRTQVLLSFLMCKKGVFGQ
jgi:hypothetical protein